MAETYKTKADYTILRKNHVNSSQGDIIENDFMTITPMDNIFDGTDQDIITSDSNFKFSYRISNNTQKKHSRRSWIKSPDGDDEWMLNDTLSGGTISDETTIRIKPDYNSIKDFAYYGSAVELVRGSMNDIIQNFPAEAYVTEKTLRSEIADIYGDSANTPSGYYISNDFGIDFHTPNVNEVNVYNKMRYFSLSYDMYDFIDSNGNASAITNVDISVSSVTCTESVSGATIADAIITVSGRSTTVKLSTYIKDGKYYLYTTNQNLRGCRIRPCKEVIDEYFNSIDEFEYVLLNRETKPLYKAEFDTPYETNRGNFYKKQSYIFPSNYDWNPDISSVAYENYVESLIILAEFHDNLDSNNIWRSMTHEAIKNLDWTFVREKDGEKEDVNIDSTKIETILQLYSRQYDGLKRYIDNIKHTNNITYNRKNNIPDYFLTDTVDIDGWDVKPLIATAKTDYMSDTLYCNMSSGYTEVDANNNFMRNLKLNSNFILSQKGTRFGIETLLGLLGINSSLNELTGEFEPDFEIKEYVAIAKGSTSGFCHFVGGLTDMIYPNAEDINFVNNRKFSVLNSGESLVPYRGIAVKEFETNDGVKYVVPWYINGEKYDSGLYFQGNGGWGKRLSNFGAKEIHLDCTTATSFTPTYAEFKYSETQTYLKFARNIEEMLGFTSSVISSGMVCYVTDISGVEVYGVDSSDASHYFILNNPDFSTTIGRVDEFDDNGWINITQTELNDISTYAAEKVVYLETLIETTEGNNSHVGYGNYDDGSEYIMSLSNIFDGSEKIGELVNFSSGDIVSAISTYDFNISLDLDKSDNKKCWYFGEGSGEWMDDYTGPTIVNPEGGESHEEPAANSIVNVKNVLIVFYYPYDFDSDELQPYIDELKSGYKKYIEDVVMPYLTQIIPSTTLFTYDIISHGDSPSPNRGTVREEDSMDGTAQNYLPQIDGVIYGRYGDPGSPDMIEVELPYDITNNRDNIID